MFDDFAKSLFSDFPEFDGLTREETSRALSRAYLRIMQIRTSGQGAADDEVARILSYLRQLANVMLFHVVLDEGRDAAQRGAGAFVAAESLALLADYVALYEGAAEEGRSVVHHTERCPRIEAALLYLIAQYDACAAGVLSLEEPRLDQAATVDVQGAVWCYRNLEWLCKMRLNPAIPTTHERDTIGRLYIELGTAAGEFAEWLGDRQQELQGGVSRLDRLIAALADPGADGIEPRRGNDYARIYHLSVLLRLSMPLLGDRSLARIPTALSAPNKVTEISC
jgi:hypothetical protein